MPDQSNSHYDMAQSICWSDPHDNLNTYGSGHKRVAVFYLLLLSVDSKTR